MIIKINIGKSQLELNEQNEMMAIHKAIILGNPPAYCHICKNKEIFKLASNKDKEGNIYVNVTCKCGAKAKLGQYKTGGYFWHQFEIYQKKNNSEPKQEHESEYKKNNYPEPKDVNPDDNSDVPF